MKRPAELDADAVRCERQAIACFLEPNPPETEPGLADHCILEDHRKLVRAAVELRGKGQLPDLALLADVAGVDLAYVADLRTVPCVVGNFPAYVKRILEFSRERRYARLAGKLPTAAVEDRSQILEQLQELQAGNADAGLRKFEDIPEIQSLEIPPVDYIVPALGIARNTITLWTGEDGSGKTILAYAMSGAVARGCDFLGMKCQQWPVLYLDMENPAYVVQSRIRAMVGEQTIPQLRVWGIWNEQEPPHYGSELLLAIAKETRPLIVVDPFRYFHDDDEDSSTAMAPVMKYLRKCAACGGAVVILHHPSKAEGSKGRGSSAIRAGCDLAFLHTLDKDASLITLKVDKNRHGERRDFTIRADFEEGKFELTEALWLKQRKNELSNLQEIISKSPGISKNQLCAAAGGRKAHTMKVIDEGSGTWWTAKSGPRGSQMYFLTGGTSSQFPLKGGELGTSQKMP